ncbi:tetratricopeptide repeat protein [Candidatus Acetothermia bacterium]|nr:tetratricopeptide repeat protein [Candidatus Acetothermia bacterium]MBI3643566.1 tetratricopeptide repeat protein [Candidatus Acetothermia bacterium]
MREATSADHSDREPVFLFSDIESSTQLWERFPEAMPEALARHDRILQEVIQKFGGQIIKHTGDGIFARFENDQALRCALEIQKRISQQDWGALGEIRLRLALHAGHAEKRGEDFFGLVIHRTARLLSAGWGGQILLTPEALQNSILPNNASIKDLGSHPLKDLGTPQHIFQLNHRDLENREFPPLKTLAVRPNNLPTQPTPFLGREQELAEITAHLRDTPCRLLTLVGPGGIGKTRLAVQTAAELIDSFAQGIYFVALAPISSAEFFLSTIADALRFNFYDAEEPKRQLFDYLREKNMLLVLDNFEHVMEGASLVAEILKSAPKIKFLVTSRERLQIQGEWVYRIHGLEFPETGARDNSESYSAVQLFMQSAERVQPRRSRAEEDRVNIAKICELVEGIPLGIELAASWVEVLPIHEIAKEIEKNQDFLSTTMRDVPERHRSLRAVFEYSWKLLSGLEQQIFRNLSVFRGGFKRDAAQEIAGADLALLSILANKSLLRVQSPGRYEMLEVLRNYASEKLEEDWREFEKTQESHSLYFTMFLQKRESHLKGENQRETLEEIREEIENVREAWRWAVAHHKLGALDDALHGLYLFYEMRSWFQEGEELFNGAIASLKSRGSSPTAPDERLTTLGRLASRQGGFCHRLGQNAKAQAMLEEALQIQQSRDNPAELALTLNNLGNVAYATGDISKAQEFHQSSLKIREEIGDPWGIATSLSNLGVVADRQGNPEKARDLFQQSLDHRRESGDRYGVASSLNNLGVLAARLGEYEAAKELHQESLALRREVGDRKGITESLNNLGVVADVLGEFEESKSFYEESLALSQEIGDQFATARTLNNLGFVAYNLGDYQRAMHFCQQSLSINREIKNQAGVVLSLNGLGNASSALGTLDEADRHFKEALRTARSFGQPAELLEVLLGMAALAMQREEDELAFGLFTLIHDHPDSEPEIKETAERFLIEMKSTRTESQARALKERAPIKSLDEMIEKLAK